MKLRKFGAACLASAVMMTSAAVLAYADETTAATEAAAVTADLTASGLTQEQVVDLIKTALTVKSREEIAAFLNSLDSVKTVLAGFEMDTIGDEDLGTLIALMTPEDLAAFTAWLVSDVSEEDLDALVDEALGDADDEELGALLGDIDLDAAAPDFIDDGIGGLLTKYSGFFEMLGLGNPSYIENLSLEEVRELVRKFIYAFQDEEFTADIKSYDPADEYIITILASLTPEQIDAFVDSLTDENLEELKAIFVEGAADINATGDVDAATDSSKGSPDTGIADVAAVAGLAVLALGGVMAARKRK